MKIFIGIAIFVICVIFVICNVHNLLTENNLVVKSIESGKSLGYKYCYHIDAFPTYQCYYADSVFNVGDTLVITKK